MSPRMSAEAATPPLILEWATWYSDHGFSIVPTIEGGKRPALESWKEFQTRRPTHNEITLWMTGLYRNCGIGLVTGTISGNVFVIDADAGPGKVGSETLDDLQMMHDDLPHTWTSNTGGGGRHYFYRAPVGVKIQTGQNVLGQHVDVRGEAGFLVLPPSPHPSGHSYAWLAGSAPSVTIIADAPAWLVALCREEAETGYKRWPPAVAAASNGNLNAFGLHIDGREEYMRDLLWARLVDERRQCPIAPQPEALERILQDCWGIYERKAKSRSGSLKSDGRGIDEMRRKLKYAVRKWDTGIKIDAGRPRPNGDWHASASKPGREPEPEPTAARATRIQTFTFLQLLTEEVEEEPDYVEEGFAQPGSFTLIAGPPKAQKSFLKQEYHVACATGSAFLCGTFNVPRPLRVFDLQAEMNSKLLRKRAREMGSFIGQRDLLQHNLVVSDRFNMILDEDGVRVAVETIKAAFPNEPPDVISFDPLANIYDQESENDNAQLMRFLTGRLEAVRRSVNSMASITLVHHSMKRSNEELARDPFVAIRGAGALRGYYDSAIVIFRESEDAKTRKIHFELRAGESPAPIRCELINGRFLKVEPNQALRDVALRDEIKRILHRRWLQKTPLNITAQTPVERKADAVIARELGAKRVSAKLVLDIIKDLLMGNECTQEEIGSHSRMKGIRVIVLPVN